MKTLFLIVAIVLLPAFAMANPFLVCDPQTDVDEYEVIFDGAPTYVPYAETDVGGETVVILMDLAGISNGNHHIEVNARNIWGHSVNVPFDFNKTVPGAPAGIGLRR